MYKRIKVYKCAGMQIFKCVGMPLCMYASIQISKFSKYVIMQPCEYATMCICVNQLLPHLGPIREFQLSLKSCNLASWTTKCLDMINP